MPLSLTQISRDAVSGVVRRLSYLAASRLAVTCKMMSREIGEAERAQKRKQWKENFKKIDIIVQPPYDSFHGIGYGSCIRICNMEEEFIEIGRRDSESDQVTVKLNGRRFTGDCSKTDRGFQAVHILEDLVCHLKHGQDPKAWFAFMDAPENSSKFRLRILFQSTHYYMDGPYEQPHFFTVQLLDE